MGFKFIKAASVLCGTIAASLLLGGACSVSTQDSHDIPVVVSTVPPEHHMDYVSEKVFTLVPVVTSSEVSYAAYTEEELDLLARLLTAEMGCSWIPDQIQLYTGSVVLNRIAHDAFPDTLYDVIYQPGQYSPAHNGSIHNTPDERTIKNARKLLEEGSILPPDVVFQANFKQGAVYHKYYDKYLGTTTYFCSIRS